MCAHVGDMLLEDTVRALLVVGDDEFVALVLQPFPEAELGITCEPRSPAEQIVPYLILNSPEETRLLLRRLTTSVKNSENLHSYVCVSLGDAPHRIRS